MAHLQSVAASIASIIATLGACVFIAGAIGWLAAMKWGKSKRSRQAIFGVVGTTGLLLGLLIAELRLRGVH